MYDDAMAEQQAFRGDPVRLAASLAYLNAVTGKTEDARKALGELKELSKRQYVSPYAIAGISSGLGDTDQCFEWLERSFSHREPTMLQLASDPKLDGVSKDSRFQDLLRRMGLPQ
jgi:hypothetical protein